MTSPLAGSTTWWLDNQTIAVTSGSISLPQELQFGDNNLLSIVIYSCMFLIAAPGNLVVLAVVLRSRIKNASARRVRLLILNLCCADLFVSLVMIPTEIAWHWTVAWRAGDVMCRVMMFFRTFGVYLGSFILIAMSVDRCEAILRPLKPSSYSETVRRILVAWILSIIASLPQVRTVEPLKT